MSKSQRRSWLDGPEIPAEFSEHGPARWPGEHLGLPAHGPNSLASVIRRAGGVTIDWIGCWIVAAFINIFTSVLGGTATLTYLLFIVLGVTTVTLFARTPGQAVLGMGVARIDSANERVGFVRALARTVFTALVLPAAMVDTDGRGMHDRATGTAVIMA
ncbi:RDD family protein [Corynebacterium sp. ES2794-CONJ1]|uniref:RDD family protein n=1 Tax=unclassified Corynebacterium TaxID=2624378 RepID=UPI0021699E91|nr:MULTISPECIES: RDD family protein [unclassified Corynebacterium]MCS4492413.1 RDD family protein [Corynebacterium sp. ES2715-CONJ3]MCS4532672.1 RDD family protein [Corynebacterium sp. ES2730-CONJ]MCU9518706.1 RDD family protein [Corynebacterium sp. ES2794-CONJ1]